LNHHAILNTSIPAADVADCSLAWPGAPSCYPGSRFIRPRHEDVRKCARALRLPVQWSPLERLMQQDISSYVFEMGQQRKKLLKDSCEEFISLSSSLQAYVLGLMYPVIPQSSNMTIAMSHGGWASTERYKSSYGEYHRVNYSSHHECMGALPPPDGLDPSLVNLLALLALLIYAHEEVRKAAWLSYMAAACTGLLPDFYATDLSTASFATCRAALVWRVFMLLAPLMQMLTAFYGD